jgi:hypothetical protein
MEKEDQTKKWGGAKRTSSDYNRSRPPSSDNLVSVS